MNTHTTHFPGLHSASFGAAAVNNMVSMFDQVRKAVVAWNARRATRYALARLSDAQLNDIGLTFGDIGNFPIEAGKY